MHRQSFSNGNFDETVKDVLKICWRPENRFAIFLNFFVNIYSEIEKNNIFYPSICTLYFFGINSLISNIFMCEQNSFEYIVLTFVFRS